MTDSEKKHKEKSVAENSQTIILPDFDAKIAEQAYYKAESRNFEPGHEMDDWLEAEQEFLQGIQ